VIQRVRHAEVTVGGEEVSAIGHGFLMLVAIVASDLTADAVALVDKVAGLRVFADDEGKMNRSLSDVGGSVLVVSQFTLAADLRRGRRPSFTGAAEPSYAEHLVATIVETFTNAGLHAESGAFGASMQVTLLNDGPVTFVLDVGEGRVR
jgi:D-tyrosyl-tRNA(Tyr) deacylase